MSGHAQTTFRFGFPMCVTGSRSVDRGFPDVRKPVGRVATAFPGVWKALRLVAAPFPDVGKPVGEHPRCDSRRPERSAGCSARSSLRPGRSKERPWPAVHEGNTAFLRPARSRLRAGIYRLGDSRVGQWSNPVSVTVGG